MYSVVVRVVQIAVLQTDQEARQPCLQILCMCVFVCVGVCVCVCVCVRERERERERERRKEREREREREKRERKKRERERVKQIHLYVLQQGALRHQGSEKLLHLVLRKHTRAVCIKQHELQLLRAK